MWHFALTAFIKFKNMNIKALQSLNKFSEYNFQLQTREVIVNGS